MRGSVNPYVCLRWSSSEIHSASTQEIAVFSGFFFALPAPSKTIGSCRVPVAIAAQVGVGAGAGAGVGAGAGASAPMPTNVAPSAPFINGIAYDV